jgi:hypothetical protein
LAWLRLNAIERKAVSVEPFPDLSELTDDDLAARLKALVAEEDAVSLRRRMLHGRIDLLRHEHVRRVKESLAEGALDPQAPVALGRELFEGTGELPDDHDLGPMPDLDTTSTDELRDLIRSLEREEDDVSLRRRFLHGQIDILRAERYRRTRGESAIGTSDLASILTHGGGEPEGA